MRRLFVATFAAFGLGLGVTTLSLLRPPAFDQIRLGAWTSSPHLGAPDVDPYARAGAAFNGLAPIGVNEGLAFQASADDRGAALDSHCSYEIAGSDLPARVWTLAAYDGAGRLQANLAERQGLNSAGLLRAANGDFVIEAARQARAGNWLPLGDSGAFVLVLRLYQASASALSSAYEGLSLPTITRGACS